MANFGEGLSQEVALELYRLFGHSTKRVEKLAGQHFQRIANAYKDEVTNLAARERLNARVATTMRVAVREAYQTNVVAVRSAPAYRKGDPKRLSGTLLTALRKNDFIIGNSHDIEFNFTTLTAVAKHWGRLNFGADPGEGYSGVHFPAISVRIQFGKNQGASYILPGEPSPGFNVPNPPAFNGYFNKRGQFFIGKPPVSGKRKSDFIIARGKASTGIGARHFMDAGLLALKANFKPFYRQHFEDAAARTKARNL